MIRIWEPFMLKDGAILSSSFAKGASMPAALPELEAAGAPAAGIANRRHCGRDRVTFVWAKGILSFVEHRETPRTIMAL